jgi:hypothetical protein
LKININYYYTTLTSKHRLEIAEKTIVVAGIFFTVTLLGLYFVSMERPAGSGRQADYRCPPGIILSGCILTLLAWRTVRQDYWLELAAIYDCIGPAPVPRWRPRPTDFCFQRDLVNQTDEPSPLEHISVT